MTSGQAPAEVWLNVKDFGAAGDGREDDTEAIQRAIDAARFPVSAETYAEPTEDEARRAHGARDKHLICGEITV